MSDWTPEMMLHAYLYDYLTKKGYTATATAFARETKIKHDKPVPIDAPEGFLYEWWAVFWDIFEENHSKSGSQEAKAYLDHQQHLQQKQKQARQTPKPIITVANPRDNITTSQSREKFPNISQPPMQSIAIKSQPGNTQRSNNTVSPYHYDQQSTSTPDYTISCARKNEILSAVHSLDLQDSCELDAPTPSQMVINLSPADRHNVANFLLKAKSSEKLATSAASKRTSKATSTTRGGANKRHIVPSSTPAWGAQAQKRSIEKAEIDPELPNFDVYNGPLDSQRHPNEAGEADSCIASLPARFLSLNALQLNSHMMAGQLTFQQVHAIRQKQLREFNSSNPMANHGHDPPLPISGMPDIEPINSAEVTEPVGGYNWKELEGLESSKILLSDNHKPLSAVDASNSNDPPPLVSIATLAGHSMKTTCCSLSRDGKYLATGSSDRSGIVWNIQNKTQAFTLDGHSHQITCVAWDEKDVSRLATCSYDKTVRIWHFPQGDDDTNALKCTLVFTGHTSAVTAVDFSRHGEAVAASIDAEGELKAWYVDTGLEYASTQLTIPNASGFTPNPLGFNPVEPNILCAAVGTTLAVVTYDQDKVPSVQYITTVHNKNIHTLSYGHGRMLLASEDTITIWEITKWTIIAAQRVQADKIASAVLISEGVLAWGEYMSLYLCRYAIETSRFPLERRKCTKLPLKDLKGVVNGLTFVADGPYTGMLCSIGTDKQDHIRLWSVNTMSLDECVLVN